VFQTKNLKPLLALFNVQSKRETELHCRDLVIYSGNLASIILAGRAGLLGNYQYACHFADCTPEHLEPTEAERDAIGRSKVGPVVDNAAKTFLREALKRNFEDPPAPLFHEVRELVLRKCTPEKQQQIRAIFEKQPLGELERLVTQKLLDVIKRVAREELKSGSTRWLDSVAEAISRCGS
jgi:hypothetical protein